MKKFFAILVLVGILLSSTLSFLPASAEYPCPDPYCPNTPPGYQFEDFRLKYAPTICEVEPNDTRFPNLPQTVITATHLAVQNWLAQLNNNSGKNSEWEMNEIVMPPTDRINLDPACNIAIVYESQELDYCGQTFNGIYFECGTIFNGITIPNPQTNTALVFIPYLMPVYGKQCEYEKNGTIYDMICRSQQTVESQPRLLKAIEHEIGHSMGLGHYIAESQDQAARWTAGTEQVPSIMVSGEEGAIEYAKVTVRDAIAVRSIYGSGGLGVNMTESGSMQNQNDLKLQPSHKPIPVWIKNVAEWWHMGKISDPDFASGMQYLAKDGIIDIQPTGNLGNHVQGIPLWIKDVAGWWGQGQASDDYFASVIQWIFQNLPSQATKQSNPTITVATDRSSYSMGDTIFISGNVKSQIAGTPVFILILDPNNMLLQTGKAQVLADGKFNTTITTTPSIWTLDGTYAVAVQYGTTDVKSQTTFYFAG